LCADPEARALDARMSKAYSALWAVMDAEERKGLLENQRYWLKYRVENCSGSAEIFCIRLETEERAKLLEEYGRWVYVEPSIHPLFRMKYDPKNKYRIIKITPRLHSKMKENNDAFNSDRLNDNDENISSDYIDFDSKYENLHYENYGYSIVYASQKIISYYLEYDGYYGGAHGLWEKTGVIYNLELKKFLTREDMFSDLDQMYGDLEKKCRSLLLKSAPEVIEGIHREAFKKDIAESSKWVFVQGGIQVHFGLYLLTGYAGGTQDCFISNHVLQKYLRPGMALAE